MLHIGHSRSGFVTVTRKQNCRYAPASGTSHSCLLRTLPLQLHPYQPQAHLGAQPLVVIMAAPHSMHHWRPDRTAPQRMPHHLQALAFQASARRTARLQALWQQHAHAAMAMRRYLMRVGSALPLRRL